MNNRHSKLKLLRDWGIFDKNNNLTVQMQRRCLGTSDDIYQNIANAIHVTLKYMNYKGSVLDQQDFMDLVEESVIKMIAKYREEINKEEDEDNHEPFKL